MGEELDNEVLGELAKDAESIKECEAIAAKYKARKVICQSKIAIN